MEPRYYAIVQALARHALYAAAALPDDHPQRRLIRHQLDRLLQEFVKRGEREREASLMAQLKWFDDGAIASTDKVVLSESTP